MLGRGSRIGPYEIVAQIGMGGMGEAMGRAPQAGSLATSSVGGRSRTLNEQELAQSSQAKVRQIGPKTFYFKNGRWVDSSLKPGEESKAVRVVQFSDDYFRLARAQKAEYNQYFSQAEPVMVKLADQVYQIDPSPGGATP